MDASGQSTATAKFFLIAPNAKCQIRKKRLLDRWININSEQHLLNKFGSAD